MGFQFPLAAVSRTPWGRQVPKEEAITIIWDGEVVAWTRAVAAGVVKSARILDRL